MPWAMRSLTSSGGVTSIEERTASTIALIEPARAARIATVLTSADFASPVAGLGSKRGSDATNERPGETTRNWGKAIAMDAQVKARVDALWKDLRI